MGTPPVPPSSSRFPPPAPPGSGPASPAVVAAALAGLLARHGLTRIYTAACPLFAVISVAGLPIWTNGLVLWWTVRGQPGTWPAADPDGAAAHLVQVTAGTHP